MAVRLPIPALTTPGISQDFDRLREAGIAHIANLSSKLWTDYNAHDPGITMLEVLCYAITDLGFRTDFPIEDLMASKEPQHASKQFFSAAEILPSNPVTPDDLRKILIDIPEIKNAWLFACEESGICVAYSLKFSLEEFQDIVTSLEELAEQLGLLRLDQDLYPQTAPFDNLHSIFAQYPQLDGPYRDLFTSILIRSKDGQYFLDGRGPLVFLYTCLFLDPNEQWYSILNLKNCQIEELLFEMSLIPDKPISDGENSLTINVRDELATHKDLFLDTFFTTQLVPISPKEASNSYPLNGLYHILAELQDEIDSENKLITDRIADKAMRKLHRYRNLAEDFERIQFIERKEIELDMVIEVDTGVDQNLVKALIIFGIQQYFNPTLRFYSLEDMLNKGKRVEDIFQTVSLNHGFLDESELEQSKLRRVIYKSDLYQVIMDVPGVKAVKCLEIDFCKESDKILSSEEEKNANEADKQLLDTYRNPWCFDICQREQYLADKAIWETDASLDGIAFVAPILCTHKPVLLQECIDIVVQKENTRVIVDEEEVREKLDLVHLLNRQVPIGSDRDLEIPSGQYRDLDQYQSIQHDFPMVYAVGEGELRPSAPARRKGQVHQLKSYLSFFDQILANYVASLEGVKEMLAVEQNPENEALFYRSLRGIVPNVEHYLIPFSQVNEGLLKHLEETNGIPAELTDLLTDFLTRAPMPEESLISELKTVLDAHWNGDLEAMIREHALIPDYYEKHLEETVKGGSRNFALRNELLDHLLARFGEVFTDFALSVIQSKEHESCRAPSVQLRRELIACKTDYLAHIPILGRDKAKAFDMLAPDCHDPLHFWDASNVSGLKIRVSKLLCLPPSTATRTKLSCTPQAVVGKSIDVDNNSFRWAIVHENNTIQVPGKTKKPRIQVLKNEEIFLEGVKKYSRSAKAEKDRKQLYDALLDANQVLEDGDMVLTINQRDGTDFFELILRNQRGTPIAVSPESLANTDRQKLVGARQELIDLMFPPSCGDGGFHLLEHILLRPFSDDIPALKPFEIAEEHPAETEDVCRSSKSKSGESIAAHPCLIADPYSFWITVIAPNDWLRFPPDSSARRFFQQIIRREAPAHLGIRFLWLDAESLFQFEELYKNWLYDEGRRQADDCQIEESMSALIHFLNRDDLRTITAPSISS